MKIVICSDHAGYEVKNNLKNYLEKNNIEVIDVGPEEFDKDDSYVYFAKKANKQVISNNCKGIYVCGSGVGMNIVANKQKGIRATVVYSEEIASLSRKHNNINVLCLGARFTSFENIIKIVNVFLNTNFDKGRHQLRVDEIE